MKPCPVPGLSNNQSRTRSFSHAGESCVEKEPRQMQVALCGALEVVKTSIYIVCNPKQVIYSQVSDRETVQAHECQKSITVHSRHWWRMPLPSPRQPSLHNAQVPNTPRRPTHGADVVIFVGSAAHDDESCCAPKSQM